MRWTEEQLAAYLQQRGTPAPLKLPDVSHPPFKPPVNGSGHLALGRLPVGTMNKTEAAYAEHLGARQACGEILWFKFEGVKLRLADNTFYTCDFAVLPADCVLEMHEIKGFMYDDANVKIKVAASIYPFRFKLVRKQAKRDGGSWLVTEYS